MSLEPEMRTVLLQLELCAAGATQAWNASGGHSGEPDDRVVALVARGEEPIHLHFRRRFVGCHSDRSRQIVLDEATQELESLRKRQVPAAETTMSLEQMILEDLRSMSLAVVAAQHRVDQAFVRRVLARHGRAEEARQQLGQALVVVPAERVRRAAELRAKGLSLRQIAMHLGVSAMTVQRDLKDAA